MAKIKVNQSDLEMAFDISDYESEAFLDTQTGKIITIYEDISAPLSDADYDDTTPLEAILAEIEEKSGGLSDWIREALTELIAIKRDNEGRYLGNSTTRFTHRLWRYGRLYRRANRPSSKRSVIGCYSRKRGISAF